MKKILFLVIVIFSVFLMSCGKDNTTPGLSNIIAQWNLINAVYVDTATKEQTSQTYTQGSYLRFNENGTCYSMINGLSDAKAWYFTGNNDGIFIDNINAFTPNNTNFSIKTITSQSLVLISRQIDDGKSQTLYLQK